MFGKSTVIFLGLVLQNSLLEFDYHPSRSYTRRNTTGYYRGLSTTMFKLTSLVLCTGAGVLAYFAGDEPEPEFVQLRQNSGSTYFVLQIPSDIGSNIEN